ncbi:hypothetical protein ACPC54_33375 [Kitasatospora sp. NPDC094028]
MMVSCGLTPVAPGRTLASHSRRFVKPGGALDAHLRRVDRDPVQLGQHPVDRPGGVGGQCRGE